MKTLLIVAGVALDVAVLALSLLLMVGGYLVWGAVALLAAFALVVAAARFWANSPTPADPADREWLVWDEDEDEDVEYGASGVEQRTVRDLWTPADPVDVHATSAIALTQPALPELPLLEPRGRHRRQP